MDITSFITKEKEYKGLTKLLDEQRSLPRRTPMLMTGLCDGARTAFIAQLVARERKNGMPPAAICVPDEKTANRLLSALDSADLNARFYPWRDMIFHNVTASHEFEHERLGALYALRRNECDAVVFTPDAALQYTLPPARLDGAVRTIDRDGDYDVKELCDFLVAAGYRAADMIDGVGQFSLRGGILDIYPPSLQYPVRVDFFDTAVDDLSSFDIITQRRFEQLDKVELTPARELALTQEDRGRLADYLGKRIKQAKTIEQREALSAELDAVRNSSNLKFADKYISFVYPERATLFDYISHDSLCIEVDRSAVNERMTSYE